jgi:glycosyltransferase involved in cell wall biosynthesis
MNRLRVAVIADFLEEGWPSMDLVAEMLMDRLRREHAATIEATLVRPALKARLSRVSRHRLASGLDRIAGRMWDYPRVVTGLAADFDLFHVVDHSYSQLIHELPGECTIVTCHDLDTFRSVLQPQSEPRGIAFRAMTRRIMDGMRKAGHVVCDSSATRDQLVRYAGIADSKTSVVHNGPHPSCTIAAEPAADWEAARLLDGRRSAIVSEASPPPVTNILHVGSTIERKRIDVLLRVVAAIRRREPAVRLVRVGGAFTAAQAASLRDLGLDDSVVVPFIDRATLAAIYRRSALLLMPSEREGFGLPVVESLMCGTPVVASGIAALREVGGEAVTYCEVDDVDGWERTVCALLDERRRRPEEWARRRAAGVARAESFSWSRYAAEIVDRYHQMAGGAGVAC